MIPHLRSRKTVCIPDLHCPYHDPAALRWALRMVDQIKPQKVILLGDVIDLMAVSRFPKSPEQQLGLQKELTASRRLISALAKKFRRRKVVYLEGNHSARMRKYLWKQAPELVECPELAVPAMIGVPDSWTWMPHNAPYMEQGVMCIHGTRWSANACNAYLNDYGCSVVAGHSHRANEINRRQPSGRVITAIESGCLCDLQQSYSRVNNWVHSITVIHGGRAELIRR